MEKPNIIYTVYLYLSAMLQSLWLCMYYMYLYFSVHLFRAVGHMCWDYCSRSPDLVPCGGKWLGFYFYYIACMSNVSIPKEKGYPNQWDLDHSKKGSMFLWDFGIVHCYTCPSLYNNKFCYVKKNLCCFYIYMQCEKLPLANSPNASVKWFWRVFHPSTQGFQSGPVPGTFTCLRSCIVPAEITEPPKISGGQNHKYDGR
jgi:hypothetical protein